MSDNVVAADPSGLARAAAIVRRGGVLIYPTETVYGIGCSPRDPGAVQRIRQVKRREAERPMLAITSDWEHVLSWLKDLPPEYRNLMHVEPPPPVTLVFSASEFAPEALVSVDGTIAIRRTSDEVARSLADASGGVLLSTSANPSGDPPPDHVSKIDRRVMGEVDLVIDAGRTLGGRPSTVITAQNARVEILREGAVPKEDLMHLLARG